MADPDVVALLHELVAIDSVNPALVAAALVACRDAARLGLAGDIVVAAVADEEHASLGVREVLRHVRADAAIVTQPTELELVVAHKGFLWMRVEVEGRAAHGSRPHLGIDAIAKAGPILVAIGELDDALRATRQRAAHRRRELLGRRRLHRRGRHPDRHVRAGWGGRPRRGRMGQRRGHRGRRAHAPGGGVAGLLTGSRLTARHVRRPSPTGVHGRLSFRRKLPKGR